MASSRVVWANSFVLLVCLANLAQAAFFRGDEKLGYDEPAGTVRGAYSYVLCETDAVIEPNSTDDVAAALKAYSAQARAQNQTLKVRLTQRLFHSSAAFTCPAQSESLPQQGGAANPPSVLAVSIIQNTMSKVLSVDKEALQMRVQPGIHLWDLAQAAGAHGMTISVGSVPVFGGLTLGGTIAAGAHGSGDGPAAADTPMDMVREVVWVDAAGERHVATPASPEWNGLYGGLGLVGVMTEFLLQLNPPSHTRFKSLLKVSDKNMVQDLERILNEGNSDVLLVWRPDMQEYTVNMMTEVNTSVPVTDPELVNTMLADLRYEAPIGSANRDNQGDIRDNAFGIMNSVLGYFVERLTVGRGWAGKPGGSVATDTEGVGLTNRLQTTMPCAPNCLFAGKQYDATAYDTEFTIEFEHLQQWVDDVKLVLQKDLWRDGATRARYLGPGYMWLRVGSGRPEYLATQYGMKRPVFVQSTWLRSREIFQYPMRYGYVQDLFELLGLAKYNGTGRFHWGKNTDRTFTDPRFPTRPRYPAFDKMLELQARFDPDKVFEPPLFAKVAAERPYTHFPGCALSYECFCTEDAHCNLPGRQVDFKCLESSAFPEFKVCKGPADWDPTLLARYGKGIWVKRTDASPLLKLAGGVSDQLMRHPVTAGLLTASSSLMSSLPMLPVLGHRK